MANMVNRVLWYSLVVSQLIYVGVASLVNLPRGDDERIVLLAPILGAMSLGVAIGTIVYRRHALVRPIQTRALDLAEPADLAKAFFPFILNLVLSESIGVYGLVLALLSGQVGYSLVFGGAALAMLWFHRPTAPDLVPPPGGYRTAPPVY